MVEEITSKIPNVPSQGTKPIHNVACGLVWPEKGFPAYYLTIGEKTQTKEQSFDAGVGKLEIIHEEQAKTFSELTKSLSERPKHHIKAIYTLMEPRFENFIRDFNKWKRGYCPDIRLFSTKSASFEASILKIRELVSEKRFLFPEKSVLKTQLAYFSESDLGDEVKFFAVRALSLVVWAFDKRTQAETAEKVPKLRSWW